MPIGLNEVMLVGYQIRYPRVKREKSGGQGPSCFPALTMLFFSAFLLLSAMFWPEGSAVLRQLLFTGVRGAGEVWERLALELESGVPVGEALTVFGRELRKGNG